MAKKGTINVVIGADLKDFSTKLQNMSRDLMKAGKNMERMGKQMSTYVTLPLAAAGAMAAKTFTGFEQAIRKVEAISGATAFEIEKLEKSALNLGRTTRYTSEQVAELQLNLSKLGLTPEEIDKSTESILNLALATGEDLAQSATVAAATMRGFGMDASEMVSIVDLMANSFSSSALDLTKFQTSMAYIAPVAKAAGATIEETTALLGVLMNSGVEASTAGTALRDIFIDLATSGNTWDESMDRLRNSTNPLADAYEMFGKRSATVAQIIATNSDQLQQLTGDFYNSKGEAKRMADIMDDSLNGTLLKVKSAVEGLGIAFGETLKPTIERVANIVISISDYFTSLDHVTKKVIVTVGLMAAAMGPLILIVGKLTIAFAAMKATIAPMLVVAGILVAIAADWAIVTGRVEQSNIKMKEAAAISEEVSKRTRSEAAEFMGLVEALKQTNNGSLEREKLINKINSTYGTTIKNIKDEAAFMNQLTGEYDAYIKKIEDRIRLSIVEQKITDYGTQKLGKQDEIKQLEADIQSYEQAQKSANESTRDFQMEEMANRARMEIMKLNFEIATLDEKMKQTVNDSKSLFKGVQGNGLEAIGGGSGSGESNKYDTSGIEKMSISIKELGASYQELNAEVHKTTQVVASETVQMIDAYETPMNSFIDRFQAKVTEMTTTIRDALVNLFVDTLGDALERFGAQLSGVENAFDGFGKNLLLTLADSAANIGKMIMLAGIASEAFQKLLFTNPIAAIGAGAALFAAAKIAKGALSDPMGSAGASYSSPSYGGGVSYQQAGFGNGTVDTVVWGQDLRITNERATRTEMRRRK